MQLDIDVSSLVVLLGLVILIVSALQYYVMNRNSD